MENINNTTEIVAEAAESVATNVGSNLSTLEKIGVVGGIAALGFGVGCLIKKFVVNPIAKKIKAKREAAKENGEQKQPDSKYVEVNREPEEDDEE